MPIQAHGRYERAQRGQNHIPITQHVGPAVANASVIELPIRQSEFQGIGKSPGFRWPWARFWQSRKPNRWKGTWRMKHRNPVGRGFEPQHGSVKYLDTYLQGNRHAWPAGGIIEYPQTQSLNTLARRKGG